MHTMTIEHHTYITMEYKRPYLFSLPPAERRKEEEKERQKERKRALVARLREIARG